MCKFYIIECHVFTVFDHVFTYIFMSDYMIILYLHLPYFHVSNSALFLHSTLVLIFYIDLVLTLLSEMQHGRVSINITNRGLVSQYVSTLAQIMAWWCQFILSHQLFLFSFRTMSYFLPRRNILALMLILASTYGALRLVTDTLYIYNNPKDAIIRSHFRNQFKYVSAKNETKKINQNTIRWSIINRTHVSIQPTPMQTLKPSSAITNNHSVFPTVLPLPARVSMVKGNPDICLSSKHLQWIFYIHTAPLNKEKRETIRNTWGNRYLFNNRRTAILFLVGIPRQENERKIIDEEYNRYGDIIQGNFIEDYRNLTLKGILGLQFISSYCSHVPYAIKSDDDVFANVFKIMQLTQEQGPHSRFLMCYRWHGMPIHRPGGNKVYKTWWLAYDILPGKKEFEPYCAGLGWILSTNIVKEMLTIAYNTPFLWIDDVYISGMVMNQVKNLTVTNFLRTVKYKGMLEEIIPFNASDYVLSHKNIKKLKQFWNGTLNQLNGGIVRELNITALTNYPTLLQRRKQLLSHE